MENIQKDKETVITVEGTNQMNPAKDRSEDITLSEGPKEEELAEISDSPVTEETPEEINQETISKGRFMAGEKDDEFWKNVTVGDKAYKVVIFEKEDKEEIKK
ncbi:MAG: hypothetical protein BWX72_01242 [Firmicutes bacterium ADurb.Bin080]|nr:MAG: hypothetical protein BWX72_01242 [Firmicutes bacterium ADurb.Bin080]